MTNHNQVWGTSAVGEGDTLDTIARETGTTVRSLLEHNPQHPDLSNLKPGDPIMVPFLHVPLVDEYALVTARRMQAEMYSLMAMPVAQAQARIQNLVADAINNTLHVLRREKADE
jgi:hypothetical protein